MQAISTKLYALFNPTNKQWIGWSFSPSVANSELLIKEVRCGEAVNLQSLKWEGDYDTGKLVDLTLEQRADVRESALIETKYSVLFRAYPPLEILETLIQQIAELVHRGVIPQKDITDKMLGLISIHGKVNAKLAKDITHFQQSPHHNFISLQQEKTALNNAFATGLEQTM
jgi:hypothetical protein